MTQAATQTGGGAPTASTSSIVCGPPSVVAGVTMPPSGSGPSSVPTPDVYAVGSTSSSVTIAWQAQTADAFIIVNAATGAQIDTVSGSASSYTYGGLQAGAEYDLQVIAVSGDLRSAPSIAVPLTTLPSGAPNFAVLSVVVQQPAYWGIPVLAAVTLQNTGGLASGVSIIPELVAGTSTSPGTRAVTPQITPGGTLTANVTAEPNYLFEPGTISSTYNFAPMTGVVFKVTLETGSPYNVTVTGQSAPFSLYVPAQDM